MATLTFPKIHIVAVEYPGYGIYKGKPNADQIEADADAVFDYFNQYLKVPKDQIIILGRSIGSGPATYLAHIKN